MKKKIGIVGGAGPMSSCFLYKFIIQECQQKFGCKNDSDFPEIVLISYPFSQMLATHDSEKNKTLIQSELQLCIDKLEKYGVDIVVIACNTLHFFLDKIDFKNLKFLNIVKETVAYSKQKSLKKLLILSTSTTTKSQIYDNLGVELVSLDDSSQEIISQIICRILVGDLLQKDSEKISEIIKQMQIKESFEGVVLACTDLSVLHEKYPVILRQKNILILDSLKILAQKVVNKVFLENKK